MQSQFKYLTLCIASAMLVACGGGSGEETGNTGSSHDQNFAEPTTDLMDDSILGFYDIDQDGQERQLRNDLMGNFEAMIQFAQSHTVDPKGNEDKNMPRLTTEKDALLLVMPLKDMGNLKQLQAQIYQDGRLLRTVELKAPAQLAATDQNNSDSRPRVVYSKRGWSVELPWNEVKPGLSIRINDLANQRSGELRAEEIDFAAPGELLVQSIRLGLLTDPPKSDGHYMLLQPEKAGTDYFQTIPAARMVVSKYDDMKLDKVMVASGVIYDEKSATNGDVYSGDMRENTAKATFSTGINLANWGVTSAALGSQEQPQLTQSVVVHHARGKYANGEANHGLSGGNGILTLIDSVGNEFSHEIGHHYGLGHYPGQVGDNQFWAAHHADSGWGYIAYRNRMRGNLFWTVNWFWDDKTGIPRFQNLYTYTRDAMSGGDLSSAISRYTHYTGYSTKIKIQPAFDRAVWDETSPTGYKHWNKDTRQMEVFQPKVPNSGNVWYNRTDGNYLKPRLFGVPVFTILGGYDPANQQALIYPAARGNWGNVFNLPQAATTAADASCWLNVKYAVKAEEHIALAPNRMQANSVNRFNVNLAQSDQPKSVDVYCKKANAQAVKLSSLTIPTYAEPLAPAVVIGQAAGYTALKKVELPQLEQALLANQGKPVAVLSANDQLLYESYKGFKSELSAAAQKELDRYSEQQSKLYRLNRWVNAYRQPLTAENPEAITAFQQFVRQLGLEQDQPLANMGTLVLPKMANSCLKVEALDNNKLNVYISGKNGCSGDASEHWVYDAMGKLHNQKYIDQCLTSAATLASCSNTQTSQVWTMDAATQQIRQGNQCLDLSGGHLPGDNGRGQVTRYTCGGGNNQKWTVLNPNHSLILASESLKNLPLLVKLLKQPEVQTPSAP